MSQEMRKAVEAIFASPQFRGAVRGLLEAQLGAVLADMVGPAFMRAMSQELPAEFLRGLAALHGGERLGYVRKRGAGVVDLVARNEAIRCARAAGTPEAELAGKWRLSVRQVRRIAATAQEQEAPVAKARRRA